MTLEDYCHAVEHSIEFQVVFLQHLYGPRVRILPVLCGAVLGGAARGRAPESQRRASPASSARWASSRRASGAAVLRAGRRLRARRAAATATPARRGRTRARWRRWRNGTDARVTDRRRRRRGFLEAGDASAATTISKWCGSSPLYTFLRAVPEARGRSLRYEQWNIDEASVVSFGALHFSDGNRAWPDARIKALIVKRVSLRAEPGGGMAGRSPFMRHPKSHYA